ncbi:pyroglutamyl-peptidase I [Falsibacillus pallidus]|uniref:Pyrrolidone-carboxylate peptidase n=1 Tax=Falsibacillus pallidus TaxID=493781 RepID=A0A370GCP6_9BACI|nr:pyroglutamyl-peptidase I [Falsibacillus pallidus]RDI41612.1 pyroglutamyl-peptidase [Falsibacillus pallidus]
MKKLLLSGFEPFLDNPINPTEQIVKELHGAVIGSYEVHGVLLPVDFEKGPLRLLEEVKQVKPDAVISLGLAAGRESITPERVAINIRDGEADNRGIKPEDSPILSDAPAAYFSTLPIRKMIDSLRDAGVPARISNTAGTYLCNNVMYSVLHELTAGEHASSVPAGFIHVPASHELAVRMPRSIPSMAQADIQRAVEIIIGVMV